LPDPPTTFSTSFLMLSVSPVTPSFATLSSETVIGAARRL